MHAAPPLIIYERGFWKPLILDALSHGWFECDPRRAIVTLHLFDRYEKRGELLDAIVCTLYGPRCDFDQSEETLRAFFDRRRLLPKGYHEQQPQMPLF